MAWGRHKTDAPPSALKKLLPLIITLVILGVVAWVCYQIYLSLVKIQEQARRQIGENVVFTKDGVQFHVENMENESYLDRTQSWVVKAWNLASPSSAAREHDEATRRKRHVLTKPREGNHD